MCSPWSSHCLQGDTHSGVGWGTGWGEVGSLDGLPWGPLGCHSLFGVRMPPEGPSPPVASRRLCGLLATLQRPLCLGSSIPSKTSQEFQGRWLVDQGSFWRPSRTQSSLCAMTLSAPLGPPSRLCRLGYRVPGAWEAWGHLTAPSCSLCGLVNRGQGPRAEVATRHLAGLSRPRP